MTELMSVLIASLLAASIGIGVISKVPENGITAKMNARIDFKQAENTADADYKLTIAACRKKPHLDKQPCLTEAKTVNGKLIVAARARMDEALSGVSGPKELARAMDHPIK